MRKGTGFDVLTNPHEVTWDGQLVSSQGRVVPNLTLPHIQEDVSQCFRISG